MPRKTKPKRPTQDDIDEIAYLAVNKVREQLKDPEFRLRGADINAIVSLVWRFGSNRSPLESEQHEEMMETRKIINDAVRMKESGGTPPEPYKFA